MGVPGQQIRCPVQRTCLSSLNFRPETYLLGRPRHDRAGALDSSWVRPVRSPSIRSPTLPAWATAPTPPANTDKPLDHELRFICRLPSGVELVPSHDHVSRAGKHFCVSPRRSRHRPVNDPGSRPVSQ